MLKFTNQYKPLWSTKKYKKDFEDIKNTLFEELKIEDDREISVVFVNDEKIKEINRDYRSKDTATDVISFAFDEGNETISIKSPFLGEIIISVDTAWTQATRYEHSKRRELCFLFTHGLLHILKYDHMTKEDEKVMFGLQKKILNKLEIIR